MKDAISISILVGAVVASGCDGSTTVRVVSPYNTSKGLSGVRVRANEGAWIVADADGLVTLEGVSTPYTLDIDQSDQTIVKTFDHPDGLDAIFQDLWRIIDVDDAELVVEVDDYDPPAEDGCALSGHVDLAAGERAFFDLSHLHFGEGTWASDTPDFEAKMRQALKTSRVGVYAITGVLDASEEFFASLSAGGHVEVDVPGERCGTLAGIDVPVAPIDSHRVTVTYTSPDVAGLEITSSWTSLRFDDMPAASLYLGGQYGTPLDGSFAPLLTRDFGTAWAGVTAFGPTRTVDGDESDPIAYWRYFQVQAPSLSASARVAADANTATLTVPTPATLLAPADGATLDASTLFRWEAVPGVERYHMDVVCRFVGKAAGNLHVHRLETTQTELTLPAFVLDAVRPGMRCGWSIAYETKTDDAERWAFSGERWVKDPR